MRLHKTARRLATNKTTAHATQTATAAYVHGMQVGTSAKERQHALAQCLPALPRDAAAVHAGVLLNVAGARFARWCLGQVLHLKSHVTISHTCTRTTIQ